MRPNPVLRRLGFSDCDRVALIHTDDIGMCQATGMLSPIWPALASSRAE